MQYGITEKGSNIVFLIVAVMGQVLGIPLYFLFSYLFNESKLSDYSILFINEFIFILLPVVIYMLVKNADFKEVLKLNTIGFLPAALVVFIAVCTQFSAWFFNTYILYLLSFIGDLPPPPIRPPSSVVEFIFAIFIIGVAPALCEEALHRGLLLNAYEGRGSIKAVIVSAVFFGIFHFDIRNLFFPILFGLAAGYAVVRTNSIYAGILAHFTNNAVVETIQFINEKNGAYQDSPRVSFTEVTDVLPVSLAACVLLVVFIFLLRAATRHALIPSQTRVSGDLVSIMLHWPVIISFLLYLASAAMLIGTIHISKSGTALYLK